MKIELYGVEKMSLTGSHLHSLIQNRNTPIVDLLVRESVQNSLDAKDESSHSKFVTVEFNTGTFDPGRLNDELDGVDLSKRPDLGNSFLSISDKNTVGLTGRHDDKAKNLYKLVFGIMEGQQASGSGGSWGIGKTVYFRAGVGLVLYYSRTKSDSGYESLLTAALIEDENRDDALLPAVNGHKYGIAWWGDEVSKGSGTIKECRDQATIDRVLANFGIQQYSNDTTGTIIILPFINESQMLTHNLPQRDPSERPLPWLTSIGAFIKLSVQKWYSARLNNKKYQLGKYLNVLINGKPLGPDGMEPFFKLTQALYNKAALANVEENNDTIGFANCDIHCERVEVYTHIKPNIAGHVAFTIVNRSQLGMNAPDYRPSPYEYIFSEKDEELFGKPILLFCRKPGMTVDYVIEGDWLRGVQSTAEDEFLIAYFVLNSSPMLQNIDTPLSLEDYVRKTEMADHFSWDDCDVSGFKPPIITRVKVNLARKIKAAFEEPEAEVERRADTGLGNLLGRMLLPPEGFGRRPAPVPFQPNNTTIARKNIRYSYGIERFTGNGMVMSIQASTGSKTVTLFGFQLEMDSTAGPVTVPTWEDEMRLEAPFIINSATLSTKRIDGVKVNTADTLLTKDGKSELDPMNYEPLISGKGDWYGISVRFQDSGAHSVDAEIEIDITIRRKDMKPKLSFEF